MDPVNEIILNDPSVNDYISWYNHATVLCGATLTTHTRIWLETVKLNKKDSPGVLSAKYNLLKSGKWIPKLWCYLPILAACTKHVSFSMSVKATVYGYEIWLKKIYEKQIWLKHLKNIADLKFIFCTTTFGFSAVVKIKWLYTHKMTLRNFISFWAMHKTLIV